MDERVDVGDKVTVTEGLFKGVEGYVAQISTNIDLIEFLRTGNEAPDTLPPSDRLTVVVDRYKSIFTSMQNVKIVTG